MTPRIFGGRVDRESDRYRGLSLVNLVRDQTYQNGQLLESTIESARRVLSSRQSVKNIGADLLWSAETSRRFRKR